MKVVDIEFVGAKLAQPENIRAKMKTKVGRPLNAKELNEDIKKLVQELRLFSRVEERTSISGQGVKVSLFVTENPAVGALILLGNEHFNRDEILAFIDTTEGGLADEITLQLDVNRIREEYLKGGYHFVQVKVSRPVDEFTTVIFQVTEGPEVQFEEVVFVGNKSFSKSDLLDAMPTSDEGGFLFGTSYVESRFTKDMVGLQRFYRGNGFLDADVTLEDRRFSTDKEQVFLTIRVRENEPYIIRSINFEGLENINEEEIRDELKSKVGDRYEQYLKVYEDLAMIRRKYRDQAFTDANPRDATRTPAEGFEVDLVFSLVEGQRSVIGDVTIVNNTETRDKVIRRLLEDLSPGQPLNTNTLDRAKRRLIRLDYFNRENLDVLTLPITNKKFESYKNVFLNVSDTDKDSVKDIAIEVEEVDTGSIRFAAGLNSNAGLVGAITYLKTNFDPTDFPDSFDDILDAFTGGGQILELSFFPGTVETQFQASYTHPFIFDSEYEFNTVLFRRARIREGWDETRTGFNVRVGRRIGNNISANLRYRLEEIRVDDIDDDVPQVVFDYQGSRVVSSLTAGITIADLDSYASPSEGYRLLLNYEYAGLGGDLEFQKIRIDTEYYLTVHQDAENRKQTLFFEGTIGYIKEFGSTDDVPIYERLFAGGQGSVRGFEFRGIGPQTGGSPEGGKIVITGSLNYDFPLYEDILKGVVFLDTGTLANGFGDGDLSNFRVAVGFGIRLKIGFLGDRPFAVDFAFPLVKYKEDQTQIISFSFSRQF